MHELISTAGPHIDRINASRQLKPEQIQETLKKQKMELWFMSGPHSREETDDPYGRRRIV